MLFGAEGRLYAWLGKRLFDLIPVISGLLILSPFMPVIVKQGNTLKRLLD